ncbi:MAG: tRNA methyltransferase [Sphingobacteriales bacterium 12-47-4]|nr:MAG: tRNA methyltransferase [Sphingobacteriales bacterium 12-47-4]
MLSKNQIKYIQSLGQKKFRDAEKVFLVEGPKSVHEFLTNPDTKIHQVYAVKDWCEKHSAEYAGIPLTEVNEIELERISQLSTPNQVLLIAAQYEESGVIDPKGHWTLALDTIQDPGNMGTILRIADWFGIKQVVCSEDCADWYNPKVVQSSMGSLGRLRLHRVSLPDWLGKWGPIPVYAAVLNGTPVQQVTRKKEGILLIGNESRGLELSLLEKAEVRVTIPRLGEAESLNAAVATGILLSHLIESGSL